MHHTTDRYFHQVYKGRHEIRLSKLVTEPSHSILTQSYDSRLRLVSYNMKHNLETLRSTFLYK